LKRWTVFEKKQQGDFTFFDELFSVRFAKTRGNVPVDVAHVVPVLVFYDLVEFHALASKGRFVFAAKDAFDRMTHTPF
jgi:hypothetical protein